MGLTVSVVIDQVHVLFKPEMSDTECIWVFHEQTQHLYGPTSPTDRSVVPCRVQAESLRLGYRCNSGIEGVHTDYYYLRVNEGIRQGVPQSLSGRVVRNGDCTSVPWTSKYPYKVLT